MTDDGRVHDGAEHRLATGRLQVGRRGRAGRDGLEREASCVVGHRRASCVSRRASGTTSVSGSKRMSPIRWSCPTRAG